MPWDRLSGISGPGQPGTGELALQAQLPASDLSAISPTPPPGPVDDVLDRLCALHGGGDLHRHLCFLVWRQGLGGLWGGAAFPGLAPCWPHPLCSDRFPFYYEIKMAFVLWLLSPYTKGASLLYRKFVHPSLSRHEKEIDTYIVQAKERSYETVLSFGKRGLNIAASAAVQAATKSQGALAGRLRSFSMQDLRSIPDDSTPVYQDPLYLEDQVPRRRPPIGYRAGGLQDSDTEEECWSDTEAVPQPPARPREKPLGRSQSLRLAKRKPLTREGTSRSLKVRTRKKTAPSDMDS
uniref:Receptor expression-enhancing protein n=1 Tax=Sus scrofa TaxID=9823 RepID=A0A8D1P2T8_PIG